MHTESGSNIEQSDVCMVIRQLVLVDARGKIELAYDVAKSRKWV